MYRRYRPLGSCLLGAFFLFAASAGIFAEDQPRPSQLHQRFRNRALILDINARVLEQNHEVIWNETHERITIPGNPVGMKLVGSNLVVAVQFTPFIRPRGENILVAQGQIWIEVPNEGIRYHTSIQTIPLEFNEPIFFFPLGPERQENNAFIEIMLTMKQYSGNESPVTDQEGNDQ